LTKVYAALEFQPELCWDTLPQCFFVRFSRLELPTNRCTNETPQHKVSFYSTQTQQQQQTKTYTQKTRGRDEIGANGSLFKRRNYG